MTTPEEHYAHGLRLLDDAERSLKQSGWTFAHVTAAIAQGHFAAASAGAAMRAIELMSHPPRTMTAAEPFEPVEATDG